MCCRSCYSNAVRSAIMVAKRRLLYSAFSIGFAVAWCYITPIACWFIANGNSHQVYRRVFRFSWTVAACLLAQIVIRKSWPSYLLQTKLTSHLSIYRSRAHNPRNLSTHQSGPKRSSRPSTMQVQPRRASLITSTPHEPNHDSAFPKRNYKLSLHAIKCIPATIRLYPSIIVCRESSRERRANGHTTAPGPRTKNCDCSLDG